MKFIKFHSSDGPVFVNPALVFAVLNDEGRSGCTLIQSTGDFISVRGSPGKVVNKLVEAMVQAPSNKED